MKTLLQPWQLLLLVFAGWINRWQQDAIEYLHTDNRKRIRSFPDEMAGAYNVDLGRPAMAGRNERGQR